MRMSVKSKYFLMTALNNLRSRVKLIRHKLSCKEASFVSLNNIDSISILLNEDNDLEEETSHLFTELSIFIFKLEERHNQTGSIYPKHRYRNRVTCF